MSSIRIAIAGITGRVGRLIQDEALQSAGIQVIGGSSRTGSTLAEIAGDADVVIDFTHASAVGHHASVLAAAGTAWVLGTSGLTALDEDAVRIASQSVPVVYAPNFAPGVNLVLALARTDGGVVAG